MSDFNIQVGAALEQGASSKLQQDLKNMKNLSIEIQSAKLADSAVSGIKSQLESALKNIKIDFGSINLGTNSTSFNSLTKSLSNQLKEISKIESLLNSKFYDAKITQLKGQLSSYLPNSSEYKQVELSLNQLTQAYEKLKVAKDAYDNNKSNGNYTSLISQYEKLISTLKLTGNEMKILKTEQDKVLSPSVKASATKSFISYFENNTKAAKKYREEIAQLEQQLQSMATVADKAKFDENFRDLQSTIIANGDTGKSLYDEVKRAFTQIGQFTGIYGILQRIPQGINQIVDNVYKVDIATTELRKVSTASTLEISNYFDDAAKSAQKYGAAIDDVISSTADWSRLGYNLKDAATLSDATTLLQKVGDNMTQETSSQGLISILKGFNKQADEVNSIIDVINQVANTEPIDTAGIVSALQRSASSLSAAGNDLNQSVAMITAANSVVQDPDSVGTAFKTMSMRIRGASTELEEAGLDAEGMAESTATLRKEILALSNVDIMIDNNTFKSTYDILDELADKWGELTDIQQASITELIAGKRQGNIMSALMSNWNLAEDTMQQALNSEGSAEKELANYQQGMEYSVDRIKAAFQQLSNTAVDSNFLKSIVDTGTNVINVLDFIIDKFGLLSTAITAISGVMGAKGLGLTNCVTYHSLRAYFYKVV